MPLYWCVPDGWMWASASTGAVEAGGVTTFTNEIRTRTEEPEKGKKPKTPGDTVTIDDYDTPLGVYVVINHVGDCFD